MHRSRESKKKTDFFILPQYHIHASIYGLNFPLLNSLTNYIILRDTHTRLYGLFSSDQCYCRCFTNLLIASELKKLNNNKKRILAIYLNRLVGYIYVCGFVLINLRKIFRAEMLRYTHKIPRFFKIIFDCNRLQCGYGSTSYKAEYYTRNMYLLLCCSIVLHYIFVVVGWLVGFFSERSKAQTNSDYNISYKCTVCSHLMKKRNETTTHTRRDCIIADLC